MGSIFSKDKDKKKDAASGKPGSAPSRLEGLDGTAPPAGVKRSLTPDSAARNKGPSPVSVSAAGDSPSPASTVSPGDPQKPNPVATLGTTDEAQSPGALTPTRRGPKKIDVVGEQTDGTQLASTLPAAVQVPEEAQAWTVVLGESVVRSLHSPDWKTREHAIQAVMRSMGNAKWNAERSPEDVWLTVSSLLDKALKDKVAPLFHASLELMATMVNTYSGQLPYSVLTQGLEPIMPTLLHRAGNNNARIQETSIQAMLTLANQPALGLGFLAPHALSPIPKKSQQGAAAASQMSGRLELLTCMLNVQAQQLMGFGTAGRTAAASAAAKASGDALSAEEILRFVRPALEMPDDKVRTAAVRTVAEVYRARKTAGQPFEVEKMLGAGIKPALLQVLHRRFAEVDEEIATGIVGGGHSGAPGSAPAQMQRGGMDEMPVGPGISIKAGKASALPPISGRGGTLPALAVIGSRGGSRPGSSLVGAPFGGAGTPDGGRPPRTPTSPSGRLRTPPRGVRAAVGDSSAPSTPQRTARSPARGAAPLPGALDEDGNPMMIQSGASTPVRGNSSQSVRNQSSLKARAGNTSNKGMGGAGGALDAAEEQLIEYILNDEARAKQ